ncbi:hypothetical protein ACH95_22695 [Bacillus glycinifermentans]|nr:hypothetical protein [Bacillus glycinifermentans]KMM52255.1 hypothetical protein ACH95_22695 [Bacillus glycinifermentans]MEC0497141.1 hypothetical protein [Bacillus glycinifermentans]MEC0542822.1 hypothetical protein [Bacillus glycinifermentans]
MVKVKVIDSIMGSGKTTYVINMMNNSSEDEHFIFITLYLDEVARIKKSCTNRKFYEPKVHSEEGETVYKLDSLHKYLAENRDIVTTHALFSMANETTKELIYSGNYTLILDEAMEVVKKLNISKDDLDMLFKNKWIINNNGQIVWNAEHEEKLNREYKGEFQNLKQLALSRNLILHNDSVLFWQFPADIFKQFKQVYNLTYLFDAQIQKYYYDLNNIQYSLYTVINDGNEYKLINYNKDNDKKIKADLKDKIKIYEGQLNKIGDDKYALSKNWFERRSALHKRLKNNILNYYQNIIKSKSKDNLWTTFKTHKSKLSGKGYTKGFLPCNTKATNEYSHKKTLVYSINRFVNPAIDDYFRSKGILINQDIYALSEMIQWIWRSAIRNGGTINIYVPSARMRGLLKNWLENKI